MGHHMNMVRAIQSEIDSDIWELAALLLDKHSELAAKIVFEMAVESFNADDYDRSAMWALVCAAIDEMQKSKTKPAN